MKNLTILALVLVLTAGLMTGCGCTSSNMDTVPTTTAAPVPTTTAPTRPSTAPSTASTMPDMEEMIPGPEDTIDPTNGANDSTKETVSHSKGINSRY